MSSIQWVSPNQDAYQVKGVDEPGGFMRPFVSATITPTEGDTLEAVHAELWTGDHSSRLAQADLPASGNVNWDTGASVVLGAHYQVDLQVTETGSGATTYNAQGVMNAGETVHGLLLPEAPLMIGAVDSLSFARPDDLTAVHYARGDDAFNRLGSWSKHAPQDYAPADPAAFLDEFLRVEDGQWGGQWDTQDDALSVSGGQGHIENLEGGSLNVRTPTITQAEYSTRTRIDLTFRLTDAALPSAGTVNVKVGRYGGNGLQGIEASLFIHADGSADVYYYALRREQWPSDNPSPQLDGRIDFITGLQGDEEFTLWLEYDHTGIRHDGSAPNSYGVTVAGSPHSWSVYDKYPQADNRNAWVAVYTMWSGVPAGEGGVSVDQYSLEDNAGSPGHVGAKRGYYLTEQFGRDIVTGQANVPWDGWTGDGTGSNSPGIYDAMHGRTRTGGETKQWKRFYRTAGHISYCMVSAWATGDNMAAGFESSTDIGARNSSTGEGWLLRFWSRSDTYAVRVQYYTTYNWASWSLIASNAFHANMGGGFFDGTRPVVFSGFHDGVTLHAYCNHADDNPFKWHQSATDTGGTKNSIADEVYCGSVVAGWHSQRYTYNYHVRDMGPDDPGPPGPNPPGAQSLLIRSRIAQRTPGRPAPDEGVGIDSVKINWSE